MRTLLFTFIVFNFQIAVGQIDSSDYEILSAVLMDSEHIRQQDRFLIQDSTSSFFIDLSNVGLYLNDKNDKNFKLVLDQFFSGDILMEMGNDSLLYGLIAKHNQVNLKRTRIEKIFDKSLSVDLFDSKEIGDWGLLYTKYPNSGGLRTFSRPSVIDDRSIVILSEMQAGNAGETSLLIMKRKNNKWTIEKRLLIGGT